MLLLICCHYFAVCTRIDTKNMSGTCQTIISSNDLESSLACQVLSSIDSKMTYLRRFGQTGQLIGVVQNCTVIYMYKL